MNLYSKLLTLIFLLFSTLLFGETLIIDKELFEDGLYTFSVENSELYNVGDLLDIYSDKEDINEKQYWKNYVDSLVVLEVSEESIILEPLWNGAGKNLKDGFFLVPAYRNIETDTPEIQDINNEKKRIKKNKIIRDKNLSFHFNTGLEYDVTFALSIFMGASFSFGNNSVKTSLHAASSVMWITYMDLTYNYNLPVLDQFDLSFGGGIVVNALLMDYSYVEVLDIVGIAVEAGFIWRTGIFFDISLNAKYYGFLTTIEGLQHNVLIGINFDF